MAVPLVSRNVRCTVPLATLPGKSSSPQHKSGAGGVNSRFGDWNQKGRSFHWDHWVFSTAVLLMGLLDVPQVPCASGPMDPCASGSMWMAPLEYPTSADLQGTRRSRTCLQICKCPNKLWLSTPLSVFMLSLFEWRRQTLTTTRNSSPKLMTTFPT